MRSNVLAIAAGALAVGFVASCDAPTRVPTTGNIAPRIELVRLDSTRASAALPPTSMRASAIGETSRVIELVRTGSVWTGVLDKLSAGTYVVIIEGLAGGQVQYYGRVTGVTVVRGETESPVILFGPAVPDVNPPALTNTTSFSQRLVFNSVTGASSYTVEYTQASDFSTGVTSFVSADTAPLIQVTQPGTWYMRTRALLPAPTNANSVPWSTVRSWIVLEATGGNDAASPRPVAVTPTAVATITARNLTPGKRSDWHDFDVRAGDSLFVETTAARLLPNASPLNTVLNLFKANGSTQIATNDDIAGSTDSRIVTVVPATERVKVQVAAVGASSGHYELRVEIRRLPAAPTALTAVVASGTSANLTWVDNADNESGYDVERCLGAACTNFTLVTTTAANVSTYADAALALGNEYRWRVRARNTVGTSAFTSIVAAATVAPAAPTALAATTVNNTRIDVAWTDNATNETGYQIERCTGAACDTFTALATLPAGTILYSDSSVVFNTTYRYQVRATNNVLPSTYSNIGTANTIPPTTPTALVATAMAGTRIDLAWTDNSTNETGFRIERCAPDGCANYAEIGTVLANVVTYQDSTVAVNTGYRYRVRAFNVVTGQDYTNVVEVGTRAPAAPTGLAATTLVGIVRLAWTDNASNEVGVVVQRCAGAACAPVDIATVPTSNLVTWDDSSAVANAAYTYRVRSYNNVGGSTPSASAAASTLIAAPVTVLSGTAISSTRINLAWTASASQGTGQILGYAVYRCVGACTPATGTVVASLPAGAVAFADSTVAAGTGYTYAVVPRTAFGETPVAGSATVFASTAFPTAPSGLTGTVLSPTSIRLNWTDNSSNETRFEVAQCSGAGCTSFTTVATTGADTASFLADTLTFSVDYRFLVRAVNTAGASPWSDTLSIGTRVPEVQTNVRVEVTAADSIRVSWSFNPARALTQTVERCSYVGATPCDNFTSIDLHDEFVRAWSYAGHTPGTTYRFRLRSNNNAGSSAYSEIATITAGVPYAAPTGVVATTTGPTSLRITWTDQTDNETRFRIVRCTGGACDPLVAGAEVGTVPRDSTLFDDTSVPTGALYRYAVEAVNGAGSLPSAAVDGHTRLPDAPGTLSATTLTDTQIDLAWSDGGIFETGYVIERCSGGSCDGFAPVDTVPANFVSFNDTGLSPNVTYRYRVRAINAVGASAYSNVAEKATDIPSAPTNLGAVAITATRIDLTWTDNATNEVNYIVERCAGICDASGTFAEIQTEIPPNVQTYADNAVGAGLTYSYRVRALNAGGPSPATNIATATTAVPNDPTNLAVTTLSGTRIQLTWDDISTRELNYEIWRCTSASCPTLALHKTIPANSATYVDTVAVNDEYRYQVRAVNNVGASGFTAEVSANTFLPAVATAFTVTTVSGTRIDLTWTDNATNETGYVLERCSGAACDSFVLLDSLPVNAAGYQDDGIAAQTSFTYRLYAYNVAGPSAFAGPSTATTITPDAPTGLASVLAAPGQIDLSWTDNANNELQYRVERCNLGSVKCGTADSMAVNGSEVATLPPGTVTYSDAGLAASTQYFYRVRATNTAGSSPYTAIVNRSTSVPIAPTGFAAVTVLATQVNLSWTDASSNETGFRIERCIGADPCTVFTEVAQVAANATTFVDNTVTAAPVVTYRVVAFNGGGGTASSVSIVSTIVPVAPSALTAAASGQTTVNLAWTDNASTEAGFYIERCTGLDCNTFVPLDTLAANAVAFADLTVTAGNVYRYRLRAFGNGNSSYTPVVGVATILPNPATGLVATAASDTRVDLTWSDNTSTDSLWNETAFNVYRCATASCTPETLRATVGRDTTVFSDSLLTPGVTFTYRVIAANLAGLAAPSNNATAATNVPAIPTSLADSTVSATAVRLSWVDNASTETGYQIERCEGSACTTFAPVDTAAANATSRVMSGLVGTTVYRFRIRAFNANGSSAYSNTVTAQPDLPPAPTALTGVNISSTQVNLAWVDNAENETAYIIERCSGSAACTFAVRDSLAPNTTSFQDATIVIDTVYQYRVRASNIVGASPYTTVAVVSTYRPATPTGLVATPISATRVDLTWTDVAANDTVIVVQRCLGGGCGNFLDIDSLPPDATSFSDLTVTVNNIYNYRLRAENAAGASVPSTSAQAETNIPSDPSGLTATVNSATQITLNWTDNSTTETSFGVERCVGDPCGAFGAPVSVAANAVTYADATVTAGNVYGYRVIARAGGGNSGPSNVATVNTSPAGPVATLTATALTATTLRLTWTAATNLSGYQIRRVVTPADTAVFASVSSGVIDTVVTVTTGLVYNFVVRAVNAAGAGAYAGTFVSMTPPPAPVLSAFPLTASQVTLAWTDTTARETGFQVERAFFSAGSFGAFATVATLGANVTSNVNTVAAPNGRYAYRVRALNAVGAGAYSNVVDLTLTGPAAPTGLVASVTAPGKITLTWTDNSDSEQQFAIDRSVGDNVNFAQLTTVGAGRLTHVDSTGIVINTAYFYRVRAVNDIAASAYTNEASAVTTVPAIVAALGTTLLSSTSIRLNWDQAGTVGELGFRVYRCTNTPGATACTDFTLLSGALAVDEITYTDVAATYGLIHRYQVRPFNLAGEPTGNLIAAPTLVLPAPTLVVVPVSRTSLRPQIGGGNNSLNGAANAFTWETGFEVEQCAGFTCTDFAPLATLAANDSMTVAGGLTANGAWYRYRTRAVAAGNLGPWSTIVAANTPRVVALGDALVAATSAEMATARNMLNYVVAMPAGSSTVEFSIGDAPGGITSNPGSYLLVSRGRGIQRFPSFLVGLPAVGDTLCSARSFSNANDPFINLGESGGCSLNHLGVTTDYYITTWSNPYANLKLTSLPGPTAYSFNNCTQTGRLGPAQGQCDAAYTGTALQGKVTVSGSGFQNWTVPFSGRWMVTATGAAGVSADSLRLGGRGAQIAGEFVLTAGQTLRLAVGQMGTRGAFGTNGGGGGGSFVFDLVGATPMLIAGGGGGTRGFVDQNGCDASLTVFGTIASGSATTTPCTVKATDAGLGGIVSSFSWGSGGAGFNGNGADDFDDALALPGGRSWANLIIGGNDPAYGGPGGFGGGGAGYGGYGGGGGGGYSGGDGGRVAGGGGSFNAGANASATAGIGTGQGSIVLKYLGPVTP